MALFVASQARLSCACSTFVKQHRKPSFQSGYQNRLRGGKRICGQSCCA